MNKALYNKFYKLVESDGNWSITEYKDYIMLNCQNNHEEDYFEDSISTVCTFGQFITDIYQRITNWDEDEHTEMWINTKHEDREGRLCIPGLRVLLNESKLINEAYEELKKIIFQNFYKYIDFGAINYY